MENTQQPRRLPRRIGRGIDAALDSCERPPDIYLSANGSTCIRMTLKFRARGAIWFIVGEACSSKAAEAAATPGRSESCFACRTSRFCFFKTVDLPPEQDFLQEQETDRASVRAKRLIVKSRCDCNGHRSA
jgi:hypothetical protein